MKKKLPSILKEIKTKVLPQIDYATQKSISYSQMSMFNECPKKWSLQYREGHKQFTSSIHTVFGTALHEVLQHYLTVMYEQSGAEADRINTAEMLEEKLREEYKKQYQANNNQHFVTPDELREFYDDGVEIIREIAKERGKHFSKRGWHLVGCEVPLVLTPNPKLQNIMFQGFLDVVLYHEPTNTFKIIDIKTSRQGWSKKEKSNEQNVEFFFIDFAKIRLDSEFRAEIRLHFIFKFINRGTLQLVPHGVEIFIEVFLQIKDGIRNIRDLAGKHPFMELFFSLVDKGSLGRKDSFSDLRTIVA